MDRKQKIRLLKDISNGLISADDLKDKPILVFLQKLEADNPASELFRLIHPATEDEARLLGCKVGEQPVLTDELSTALKGKVQYLIKITRSTITKPQS